MNKTTPAHLPSYMLKIGSVVGTVSIICAGILLLMRATGPFMNFVFFSAPVFILFAFISIVVLARLNRYVLVAFVVFVSIAVSGFIAPSESAYVKFLSSGLAYYDTLLFFVNPVFVSGLVLFVVLTYELICLLRRGKSAGEVRSYAPWVLTICAAAYSVFVSIVAVIIMIGLTKTDWF